VEDLSLHILDIAENAVEAGATRIEIAVSEDSLRDLLVIAVSDNGRGMDPATLRRVLDPFLTTRTTRRVGLGLPLLRESARSANGDLTIHSTPHRGTTVTASFQLSHIDRRPLGDIAQTITTLVAARPQMELLYRHNRDSRSVALTTEEIRRHIDGAAMSNPEVLTFIREYIRQQEQSLSDHSQELA
jgi:K+-sensing histidine kinase KdpD